MTHLTPDMLLDLADRTRPEADVPHLGSCETCRRQLAEIRATLEVVNEADVPEPSPLFWDHMSARVRTAIESDDHTTNEGWFRGWRVSGLAIPVGAAAALLLIAAVGLRLGFLTGPDTGTDEGGVAAVVSDSSPAPDGPVAEETDSLTLISDLAADLEWEVAVEAGVATRAGTLDRVVSELSDPERMELQRLLKIELNADVPGNGA
jgi:hypothetical protein